MSHTVLPAGAVADDTGRTPVGVDLGVRNLFVAAPVTAGVRIDEALVVDGDLVRALYDEYVAVTRRLDATPGDTHERERAAARAYRAALTDRFAEAAVRLLAYLDGVDAPVVVLEDLTAEPRPLADCGRECVDVGTWVLPALQRRLSAVCADVGVPVAYVDPEFTSQECHHCGELGKRVRGAWLRCETATCPVDEVECDRSAAVSIARRFAPGVVSR